jgi:uracil-DNA glycosylase family 4
LIYIDHPFEGLSHTYVCPTGPSPCKVLFVGESPGHEEDITGRCFVGKTGRELNDFYLPLAGLQRRNVRVTNLLPLHPFANRNPTKPEIEFFENWLIEEIAETDPKIIVPLGAFATKYFLGGHREMHQVHGLPYKVKEYPDCTIIPCHHPAAGLHNTETQPLIVYDFQQVALAIEGKLPERAIDNYKEPVYIELTTPKEVFVSLEGCGSVLMGSDTEGYRGHPWGLSYSIHPGVAYVIRIASKEALHAFAQWIKAHPEVCIIMHNALHDLPIYREMGIEIVNFEDTMVYAYCLCLEPQGLKDLAYRHCGMRMKSYDDVVSPAVRELTANYLLKVASEDWGLDPPVPKMESAKDITYTQPQALHKRALRAVNDIFGMYTGTIVGPKRGGSAKLKDLGVRVGLVDKTQTLPKDLNGWICEVPIPILPKLEEHFGEFVYDLKPPVTPEDPPDAIKRWAAMKDDLEESVERAEAKLGRLPVVGLDALKDQEVAVNYSARDAHATLAIRKALRDKIEANGMLNLSQLDMAVLPYIDRMKTAGIRVDKEHMLSYGAQLKIEMRALQEKLERDLGVWINPSSSQQVAMVIYEMLGFPVEVRTKEGDPSTNDKVLEALAPLHASITDITDYRELNKLRGTYALALPNFMDRRGRIHPNWKVTRVPTGRLACSDPNLMAIPIRSARGNMIRKGFIPAPGKCFVGVDLSQIEMRILAHLSQDPNLIKLFVEGLDFHSATAAFMWRVSMEEIDAEHDIDKFEKKYGRKWDGPAPDPNKAGGASRRSSGKNVSFGIVYGVTAKGLQAQVKSKTHQEWSEDECQRMIDSWLEEAYSRVKVYMERQKSLARDKGFVQTLLGRRRYLPGVHSTVPRIREEAYRQAINMPVQGSASEVIKLAEKKILADVLPKLWGRKIEVEPVLQIHDELVFEVESGAAKEVATEVIEAMETAMEICVPIIAEAHITPAFEHGGSWANLKCTGGPMLRTSCEYSEAEMLLITYFGFREIAPNMFPPLLYPMMGYKAFMMDERSAYTVALRNVCQAMDLQIGPKRLTEEFDMLILKEFVIGGGQSSIDNYLVRYRKEDKNG